ncbi:MAG TPA: prepilin-type N-terminal cleavage/methylation domain-containing protein [Phycisphaerales bacterium]|nr:prepilin-type N-terminal cleavage/methylation domain-containing protein [Phycisphaerales bacterium]
MLLEVTGAGLKGLGGRGKRRCAFTLLELLVVVAVMAILLSVLLPAIRSARASGQTIVCLSNMRQLQAAQLLYCNDHKGQLVDYGLGHGVVHDEESLSWYKDLLPYYDTPVAVRSPADTSPHWPVSQGGDGTAVPESQGTRFRKTSYGLNEMLTPRPPFDPEAGRQWFFDKIDRIKNPSSVIQFVIMAYEGEFSGSDHIHVSNWYSPFLPPDSAATLASNMMQVNAHGGMSAVSPDGRSNYTFLDGHAATLSFREVYTDPERNKFDPRVAR